MISIAWFQYIKSEKSLESLNRTETGQKPENEINIFVFDILQFEFCNKMLRWQWCWWQSLIDNFMNHELWLCLLNICVGFIMRYYCWHQVWHPHPSPTFRHQHWLFFLSELFFVALSNYEKLIWSQMINAFVSEADFDKVYERAYHTRDPGTYE